MLEHRGSVNRIAVSPASEHFATVSSDATLKLWDCEKLSGKGVINQSKCTWDKSGTGETFLKLLSASEELSRIPDKLFIVSVSKSKTCDDWHSLENRREI